MTTTKQEENTQMGTSGIDVNASGELQVSTRVATAQQEIQAAVIVAKKFPRDHDVFFEKLTKACQRKTLADIATYKFPVGGKLIKGQSVNLARVAAQLWGNIRWGIEILRNNEDYIAIKGWAWDMESNNKAAYEGDFRKLIYRKKGGWKKPDERELRMLVSKEGQILVRNSLLHIMPTDMLEDAVAVCEKTLKQSMKDPDGEKKRLILEFQKFGVTVKTLKEHIGYESWGPDELVELGQILNALKDGVAKVSDFFGDKKESNGQTTGNVEETLKSKAKNVKTEEKSKESVDTETGEVKEEAGEPDKDALLKRITNLEGIKDFGETKVVDFRVEHAGEADLRNLEASKLVEYMEALEGLPDKGAEKSGF